MWDKTDCPGCVTKSNFLAFIPLIHKRGAALTTCWRFSPVAFCYEWVKGTKAKRGLYPASPPAMRTMKQAQRCQYDCSADKPHKGTTAALYQMQRGRGRRGGLGHSNRRPVWSMCGPLSHQLVQSHPQPR